MTFDVAFEVIVQAVYNDVTSGTLADRIFKAAYNVTFGVLTDGIFNVAYNVTFGALTNVKYVAGKALVDFNIKHYVLFVNI